MTEKIQFLIHFFVTLAKFIRPGGIKTVIAENLLLKQQLITITCQRSRAPRLTIFDRFMFGYLAFFISKERLQKIAVSLQPATILKFHQALVKRKYQDLYSRKTRIKPGRKGPEQDLIELVVEMKLRNPRFGYGRIAMQSRRIIGFSVHTGNPDGIAVCCMFNKIIANKALPKCLSSDNDPLFKFHRWQANLRILGIDEIKTIPGVPTSHPFVERSIGLCRQEFLNHVLFWNAEDLVKKLDQYQNYHNETRAHSSLNKKTPNQKAANDDISNKVVPMKNIRWKSHCRGLFNLPVAA